MLPNAGGIPDDDFTVGITFDPRGDLYVSNVTGIYRIAAEDLRPQTLEQPVANVKIADIPEGLQFPMGPGGRHQGPSVCERYLGWCDLQNPSHHG